MLGNIDIRTTFCCLEPINILTYPKLTFSIDQRAFRRLTRVDCEATGETFNGALVEPITDKYHVRGQIIIVQIAVRILARRLPNHYASVETVYLLHAGMSVPEMSTFVTGCPLIPLYVLYNHFLFHKSYKDV